MESKELTVVIVTFKSDKILIDCLKSIHNKTPVIVIENSNDVNFKKKIEETYGNVECILVGENKGYAVANNIGLRKAKTKYALVLNPDTIVNKNAINNFFNFTNLVKDFWLMGPANDQMQELNFVEKSFLEVNNLKGFAIFINLKKFKDNFFDEKFFLYFEEIDLCKRVKKNKGKIYLSRDVIIKHRGSSSVNENDEFKLEKNRNWHWMWSTFYFHKKYKGFIMALIIVFPKLLSAFVKTAIYFLILNKKKRDVYFCRLSGLFNSIIGNKSWYRPS